MSRTGKHEYTETIIHKKEFKYHISVFTINEHVNI